MLITAWVSSSAGEVVKCNKSTWAPPAPVFVDSTLIASPEPFIWSKPPKPDSLPIPTLPV